MSTPADRLRAARRDAGFATATDAAEALGVKRDTYIQHENGTRDFGDARAEVYARKFKTTPEWLRFGRGAASLESGMVPIIGRVGADPEGLVILSEGQAGPDFAPVQPGGSLNSRALDVRGYSMRGLADDGSLVYFNEQHTKPLPAMEGHPVIVELVDGRVMLKRLLRGSTKGTWNLESINGPLIENAQIRWVAVVSAIIPPYMARQITVRGGEAA